MYATVKALEDLGIVAAGTGQDLEEAREAKYLETPKGRIGLVAMASISSAGYPGNPASYVYEGNTGGNAGENPLHLNVSLVVTAEQMEVLRKVRDELYEHRADYPHPVAPISPNEPKDRLQMTRYGGSYKVGDKPGTVSYTMNQEDLQQNLRSIRNGKESSSFMLASLHALEDSSPLAWDGTSEYPPDFAIELAHKAIDNGADVFLAHGVHHLRGVEIYKGKPIFYGLSHFTFQLNQQPTMPGSFAALRADPYHTDITDAEAMWAQWASTGIFRMDAPETLQSMVVLQMPVSLVLAD
jgi:poly-gamma-glutamate synthesis protein (capsule biosynthesis protein)